MGITIVPISHCQLLAKKVANRVDHEAADLIQVGSGIPRLLERLRDVRGRMTTLSEADKLMSIASYEICEREPAGSHAEDYSSRLQEWVFQPILEGIGVMAESESVN
jgi:hypothetical protein